MSILYPNIIIESPLGSYSAGEALIAHASIELSTGRQHDSAEIVTALASPLASYSIGDTLSIKLGEMKKETVVFTGIITNHAIDSESITIELLSPTYVLSETYISQNFSGMTGAEIIQELAGEIAVDTAICDTMFHSFNVHNRQDCWSAIVQLAHITGSEITTSPEGAIAFKVPELSSIVSSFAYGSQIIDWQIASVSPLTPYGFAPHYSSSTLGNEKWHWIQNKATSTNMADAPLQTPGLLSSQDAADALEEQLLSKARQSSISAQVTLTGSPELRAGNNISITDCPQIDTELFHVTTVTHSINSIEGFRSTLSLTGVGNE